MNKFNVGDKVKIINTGNLPSSYLPYLNEILTIDEVRPEPSNFPYGVIATTGYPMYLRETELELVKETVVHKVDCNITENYFKEKTRMTARHGTKAVCTISCLACPLGSQNNGEHVSCQKLEDNCTDKAITIVQKWSDENPIKPVKTIMDDFFEKFPNALKDDDGTPSNICPSDLGYCENCVDHGCLKCWSQPFEEVQS